MTYELYLVTNKLNGKRYVGQTKSCIGYLSRWETHCHEALTHKGQQNIFHSAIKGYGVKCFEVKRLLHNIPEDKIDELETIWIKKLNTFYLDGYGYNMTRGGQGIHGYQHTNESKMKITNTSNKLWQYYRTNPIMLKERNLKISLSQKNRPKSKEHCKKLSEAAKKRFSDSPGTFLGRKHTEETKRKLSEIHKNQKASEETKYKMVLTRGTPVQMLHPVTYEVLNTFEALSIARIYLIYIGVTKSYYATDSIRRACHTGNIVYGYRWKFLGSVTTSPDECKDVEGKMSYPSKHATKINLF